MKKTVIITIHYQNNYDYLLNPKVTKPISLLTFPDRKKWQP